MTGMGVRTTTIWRDGVDSASVPRISSHDGCCRIVLAKEGCGEVVSLWRLLTRRV